eukprot:1498066-Amphidinium_carterae.1
MATLFDGDEDDFVAEQEAQAPDEEFAQFLNEAAQLDRDDSDVDSDEWGDEVGALPNLVPGPPAGLDLPLSIVFLLDVSRSMEKEDVAGDKPGCRRIDAAVAALRHFMQHQHASGAASDTYTLAAVNREITVVFESMRYADAVEALDEEEFEPGYSIDYDVVVEAISTWCDCHRGQRSRVVFVSDGCYGGLRRTTLPQFQEVVRADPNLMVHTFGLGCSDFSTLQQLAQIGRGSFLWASMDMNGLINTFTTASTTITQTRTAGYAKERRQRNVAFEDAKKWNGNTFMGRNQGPFRCTRTTYNLSSRMHRSSDTRSGIRPRKQYERQERTKVYISPQPFMVGGMRLVYQFRDTAIPKRMVAKWSKYVEDEDSKSFAETFIQNTICARTFSGQFHDDVWWSAWKSGCAREPPRLVSCAQCWLYEL